MDVTTIIIHILFFISLYFEVFLLITFIEKYKTHQASKSREISYYPTVSIIVPAYNEEKAVIKTITSLLNLNYPKEKLSIIAIDDGSTDNTWQVLQQFKNHPQVQIHTKPNGGKHSALNFGIKQTNSELIGCLDADSFVDSEALNEIIRTFHADSELMSVTPAIKISNPQSFIQIIQKAEYDLSIFIRRTFSFLDGMFVTPGPFSFFKREVFEQLGEYKNAHNTEDMEMALRMQTHHMRIGNAHTAFVYTHGPRTFRALVKQRVRWTFGFMKNIIEYRHLLFNPKYGNIGMLVLPVAIISIASALFFAGLFIWGLWQVIVRNYIKISTVGLTSPGTPQLDWFYINTQSGILLTITLIAIAISLVMIGKKISNERRIVSFDLLLYVLFYGLLAPFWLARAVYNVARSKKTSWTAEIDAGGR